MFTINNISKSDYPAFKERVIKTHYKTLKKYLNYFEIYKLKTGFFIWLRKKIYDNKFRKMEGITIGTEIKYGCKNIEIPIEFDTVMNAILKKDLTVPGLFRISATYSLLNSVEVETLKMFKEMRSTEYVTEFLMKYDSILLTNLFTRLINHFDSTLFPREFLEIALKVYKIEDENDRKICFKVLMVAFPYAKRCMFESIGKFVNTVSEENTKFDEKHVKTMNLNGICKVIAPKLFLLKSEVIDPFKIHDYVGILDYIYDSMPEIIEIDKDFN